MENKADFLMQLSGNIRTHRQLKQFSQEGFAKHVKIARRYYGDIETGKANPSIIHLMKIAIGLGVSLATLVPDGFFAQELSDHSL